MKVVTGIVMIPHGVFYEKRFRTAYYVFEMVKVFQEKKIDSKIDTKKIILGINKQRLDQNITRQIKATQTFSLSAQRQNTA